MDLIIGVLCQVEDDQLFFWGEYVNLLNININHIGRLNDNVTIMWLEMLKNIW